MKKKTTWTPSPIPRTPQWGKNAEKKARRMAGPVTVRQATPEERRRFGIGDE